MTDVVGWYKANLGQLLVLIRNGYAGQQINRITPYSVSRIETISNGIVDTTKVGFVENIPESYLLQPGDILISNINSVKHIGKVAQVGPGVRLYHGMNLLVLRPNDGVDSNLLFFLLSAAKPWFQKVAAQAINQASINQTTIKSLRLELPSRKAEQSKIAEVLSTVDRAIEQTEALIAKQQRIKTGLMQDLLTRGIDEHGNLRSEETHEFKDSPLGRIPAEWEARRLSEVADLRVGYAFKSSSFSEDGVRLLRGENVGTGNADWKDTRCLPGHMAKKYPEYMLASGDLIIGMDRTFTKQGFKVTLLGDTDAPCLLVQRVGCFDALEIPVIFMRLLIQSPRYQRELLLQQKGMDIPHLSKSEILTPLVPVPSSKSEMQEIGIRVDTLLSAIEDNCRGCNKLRSLKTALMQDLLTGKVRVTPLLEKEREAVTA